jgi:hypothetical protein
MDAVNAITSLRRLTAALRDYSPDSPEVVSILTSSRKSLDVAKRILIGKPFVIKPSQLDTTQPRDVGYGTPEWKEAWYKLPSNRRLHPVQRPNALSCWRNLHHFVTSKYVIGAICRGGVNTDLIIPEFSQKEGRRCCFVKASGMRCTQYSALGAPICEYHYRLVESVPRMNDRFLTAIKNESLRTAYQKHLQDPNRKSIESEVALMRAMLDALLHRVEVGADLNKLPIEMMGAITTMCEKITGTVEKMANMEAKLGMRLSLDQVTNIIYAVIDLVFKTCPNLDQQQLTAIADGVEKLPIMRTQSVESIEANKEYGCDITEEDGVKCATPRAKYTDDGKVHLNAFTPEQVVEERMMIRKKFEPATQAFEAKMDILRKAAEDHGVEQ